MVNVFTKLHPVFFIKIMKNILELDDKLKVAKFQKLILISCHLHSFANK